jgi:hypothetical protein
MLSLVSLMNLLDLRVLGFGCFWLRLNVCLLRAWNTIRSCEVCTAPYYSRADATQTDGGDKKSLPLRARFGTSVGPAVLLRLSFFSSLRSSLSILRVSLAMRSKSTKSYACKTTCGS